jgi:protein-S-isoprenylcysteine O-methyltransferase Ste14
VWRNVPLPEPHLGGVAVGVVLQWVMPLTIPVSGAVRIAGVLLVLVGLVVIVWAVRAAGREHLARAEHLVVTGPYAWCRHPMYVGWTAAYLGVAAITGNGWLVLLLPIVLGLTHLAALREERRLREQFGEEYERYARKVGRYGIQRSKMDGA